MSRVTILECIDTDDPGSEGRFLRHALNMMNVSNQYLEIRTKAQLLANLGAIPASCDVVHLTTHGSISDDKFTGFWTHGSVVEAEDFEDIDLLGRTFVTTACKSGNQAFAESVIRHTGCRSYIGPSGSPSFQTSALFSHLFYHYTMVGGASPARALEKYNRVWTNKYEFQLFERRTRKKRR